MKLRLCLEILKNIGYLMSFDFWKAAMFDKDFPAGKIFLLMLFAGCADILQMIVKPGYPEKAPE